MKLFRKIYLQVLAGMIVLAFGMLFFLLWEVDRYSRSDLCRYEKDEIAYSIGAIREKVRSEGMFSAEGAVKNAVVVSAFGSMFGERGILWRGGNEAYNRTPYVFDKAELDKQYQNEKGLSKSAVYVSRVQSAGGKKLLVFYQKDAGLGSDDYSFAVYKDITAIYLRTQKLFYHGLGITLCMMAAAGMFLYRRIYQAVQPLAALKQAAVRISGGDYGTRVPACTEDLDEVAQVTESFNQMACKVQEHMDALSQTNENQQRMLGSLAHELKTPLTAIIGNADLLLTVSLGEQNRTKALNYILEEAKRLSRLSEKMLELAGLSGQGGFIIRKEAGVQDILDRLREGVEFQLKEKGIHLKIKCAPHHLEKYMDEDLMLSLLMNLVDNACKASGRDADILVSADQAGISVQDFGIGIPQEELCRVTEAFYRIDPSRSGNGGAGLGLALCSQIAQLHGGTLRIESIEGEGTKVAVLW